MSVAANSRRSIPVGRGETRRMPAWALTIICVGAVVYVILFVLSILHSDTDLLGGLTIAPVLIALTVPIAFRIARSDRDPTLIGIVMAGVVAKFLGSLLRYYVAFELYGNSDSLQYHQAARELAPNFRSGIFDAGLGHVDGTVFIKIVTGVVYALFGVSKITAFFIFSWLGFLGLLLLARAFRIAVPQGDSRRYLILVLFLPSLVYWPSAIGKEAWLMLGIGLLAYGIACIYRGRSSGVVAVGAGLLLVLPVRPHVAMLMFVGFVFGLLVRRAPARSYAAPLFRWLGFAALLVAGVVLAGTTAEYVDRELHTTSGELGRTTLSVGGLSAALEDTAKTTADGGSEFTPIAIRTPLDMGPAFVTVFFRPFPFEASNAQTLLSSAEVVFLFGLSVASWRRLRSIPRLIRSAPYIAFCIGYLIPFVYAFSSFSNFGILARQRVQALPFYLVLLALPAFQTLPSVRAARELRQAPSRPAVPAPRRRARR